MVEKIFDLKSEAKIGRAHSPLERAETEESGVKFVHIINSAFVGDLMFQSHAPVTGVYQQAS